MPYHEFLVARRALHGIQAIEQLSMATGIALAIVSDENGGDILRDEVRREARGEHGPQRR